MAKRRETARERRRRLRASAQCAGAAPVPSAARSSGELRILNTGAGDVRISFRPDASPQEVKQARELIEKMLRDGYALLIQTPDGSYARAKGFDPETHSYILSTAPAEAEPATAEPPAAAAPRRRGRPHKAVKTVKVADAKAVAVARSAGG